MSARILVLVGVISFVGCSNRSAPLPTGTAARQALETALDAWKTGQSPSSLVQRQPSIEVVDFQWSSGEALIAYSLGRDVPGQGTQTISASLTLKGHPSKDVKYMVFGTNPLQIYRDEDFTRAMNMENNPAPSRKPKR